MKQTVGTASGIVNFGAVMSLKRYFYKKLPFATGFGSSGVGFGALALGLAVKYLLNTYSWRVGTDCNNFILVFEFFKVYFIAFIIVMSKTCVICFVLFFENLLVDHKVKFKFGNSLTFC